jgi:hypothetical protein
MNNSEKPDFPTMGCEYINNSDQTPTFGQFGEVTKREYFAAKGSEGSGIVRCYRLVYTCVGRE